MHAEVLQAMYDGRTPSAGHDANFDCRRLSGLFHAPLLFKLCVIN